MVLEIAQIDVRPGDEEAFIKAYAEARALVAESPGCLSVRMTRGVESPSRFVLLVEWETLDAHTEGFRASDRFPQWRGLIGPYFASPPQVEHFADL
jgi:heme-degrading monooxygenase HmoA